MPYGQVYDMGCPKPSNDRILSLFMLRFFLHHLIVFMELNYLEAYQYESKQLDLYYRLVCDMIDKEYKKDK